MLVSYYLLHLLLFLVRESQGSPPPYSSSQSLFGWRRRANKSSSFWALLISRGGSTKQHSSTTKDADAYRLLAVATKSIMDDDDDSFSTTTIDDMRDAFKSLAVSQSALKGLDGAAHEAYQRTHDDTVDTGVTGRAKRTALRTAATACALEACELCEMVERNVYAEEEDRQRQVLLNVTLLQQSTERRSAWSNNNLRLIVLYEPSYHGGVGVEHGSLLSEDRADKEEPTGQLLVVLAYENDSLDQTLQVLAREPAHVRLHQGLVSNEVASVQSVLYQAAGLVLARIEPILRQYNNNNATSIHVVGRSLAGGVASLVATILDGKIPVPGEKKKKKKRKNQGQTAVLTQDDVNNTIATNETLPLQGLGSGRTSAVTLGAPPCISPNVQTDFIISFLYGDDIVCRSSKESLDRFLKRTRRALKSGVFGRRVSWMTDTVSLAASNLKSHAHGSEGEEARLTVPGRAYLVRPRRLGGFCSIHEVGGQLKGGREALRAAVLWQLNDILLSKSMWKHHQLESYIHGLDRVHLRGLDEEDQVVSEENDHNY